MKYEIIICGVVKIVINSIIGSSFSRVRGLPGCAVEAGSPVDASSAFVLAPGS